MEDESSGEAFFKCLKMCTIAIPVLGIPLIMFLLVLEALGVIKILIFWQ